MISLEEVKPFAEGGNRVCYIHPDNKNLCLKISKSEVIKKMRSNAPWYKKLRSENSFDDNYREERAYQQRAIKKNPQKIWKHLAKWYGMVETSIGLASETELIRDNKNNIAITLEKYLFTYGMTDEIKEALKDFESWLRSTLVLTKNIIPHNIVLGYEDDKIILKIVDGLGSKSYLPFTYTSDFFASKYVERRIELMQSRINWDLTGRKGNWK